MIIKEYKPTDREACIKVFNSNVPKFFASHELDGFKSWLTSKDKAIKAFDNNESEYYYVVEIDNQIIGCGGFYIPGSGDEARMAWGMVENSLHKKGIGRSLLEYRMDEIRRLKPGIIIALDTTQYSYGFFEKSGFTVIRFQKDFYAKGLDRYDMVGSNII